MEIQFIYTFHKREQEVINSFITKEALNSKLSLMEEAMRHLKKVERSELVKVSCRVFNISEGYKLPDWYLNINGKLWLDDIEGYRFIYGIKSTVPKDYLVQWLKDNNANLVLDWL